ncbi:hypothetical protein PRAG_00114 [Prochlorococcus phage P-SSM3]|jgi:hypothetical protein|uniref:Uncharacterized protein n=1 Tax=Prochlorococcus phage P-SSM3 TaxID=536453 RepID=R9S7P8_9CAUD|nr:hypothetical protein PRAG_00114 [Prochlorococcus phage P-SSM3]AGN12054.1 hypothetical protein PRAG_00114 [Prochlorococcus phage P-SSM3]|tara:strand:- start:245 stop:592 length:348 start_codon:yes stop_codon:yes gene_type:complete
MDDIEEMVERAVDLAFEDDKFYFRCYDYLKNSKATRAYTRKFIDSPTAGGLALTISDLDAYIQGGSDRDHQLLREAYGHLGKPRARKIRKYLYTILEGAWLYEKERKPGRKKRSK